MQILVFFLSLASVWGDLKVKHTPSPWVIALFTGGLSAGASLSALSSRKPSMALQHPFILWLWAPCQWAADMGAPSRDSFS